MAVFNAFGFERSIKLFQVCWINATQSILNVDNLFNSDHYVDAGVEERIRAVYVDCRTQFFK